MHWERSGQFISVYLRCFTRHVVADFVQLKGAIGGLDTIELVKRSSVMFLIYYKWTMFYCKIDYWIRYGFTNNGAIYNK